MHTPIRAKSDVAREKCGSRFQPFEIKLSEDVESVEFVQTCRARKERRSRLWRRGWRF
jgi:hypothetical protein